MSFEVRKPYRALNGAELKEIMVAKLKQAMDLDATLNLMRSFPLVRYRVQVEITPFKRVGLNSADVAPDKSMVYEIEGEAFLPVMEEALELIDESPIYGVNADPQHLRKETSGEVVETRRTEMGEIVDVRVKETPPKGIPERVSSRPLAPPQEAAVGPDGGPAMATPTLDERADWTSTADGGNMQNRPGYAETDRAVGEAVREGQVPPSGAGRVSVVGSGGRQDHGKRPPVNFGRKQ